jgi:hypothetical protein
VKVTTEELRRATLMLLEHLEDSDQQVFEIAADYYWDIPHDDWAEVQRIVDGKGAPVGYGLVWLSSMLRYVGERALG